MMPDKIYVRKEEMGDVWALDATTWENGGKEYISKDALWKWADKYYSKCILNNGRDTGRREVLKSLLHYINRT